MTAYESYITALTPFLWARLNESFGSTVLTNSAGGPDGTLYGSSVLGQPGLVPDGGTSVYFPGDLGSYATYPPIGAKDDDFTVIATIMPDAADTGTVENIVAVGDAGSGGTMGWMFRWYPVEDALYFSWYRGGWWSRISVGLGDIRGIPTQVAVVVSWVTGLYVDFYKNGVLLNSTALPASYKPTGNYDLHPIHIGVNDWNSTTQGAMKGYEDEVLYFQTALNATQISEIYGLSPAGIGGSGGTSYNAFLRRRRR